jgi:hypothetical protein
MLSQLPDWHNVGLCIRWCAALPIIEQFAHLGHTKVLHILTRLTLQYLQTYYTMLCDLYYV